MLMVKKNSNGYGKEVKKEREKGKSGGLDFSAISANGV
jgi:hypothetical protein